MTRPMAMADIDDAENDADSDAVFVNLASMCAGCGGAVFHAEERLVLGRKWHKTCFKCFQCGKPLTTDFVEMADAAAGATDAGAAVSSSAPSNAGPPRKNADRAKHKPCCRPCSVKLSSPPPKGDIVVGGKRKSLTTTMTKCLEEMRETALDSAEDEEEEEEEGEWMRKKAVNGTPESGNEGKSQGQQLFASLGEKHVKPKNKSSSASSSPVAKTASLSATATTTASLTNRESCLRCGKIVYAAERCQASGKIFHKSCFSCCNCCKKMEVGAHCDKDDEVFCKTCYARLFGPKGLGRQAQEDWL